MTPLRDHYRAWGDALHADLEAHYGYGLGDLESSVDLSDLFEIYADAETALTMAGMCFCDALDGELCGTCEAERALEGGADE